MLKRAVIVLVSLTFAVLCTAVAHIGYVTLTVIWLDRIHFFNYHYPMAHLLCAIAVLGIAVLIFLRARDVAALLLLAGAIGLLGATLHDCFISWGMTYHWFQFGGTEGWVFRGFFEPQENPVLVFTAHTFEAMRLLVYIAIFWVSLRFARKHLTSRWSRPRAAVLSSFA